MSLSVFSTVEYEKEGAPCRIQNTIEGRKKRKLFLVDTIFSTAPSLVSSADLIVKTAASRSVKLSCF